MPKEDIPAEKKAQWTCHPTSQPMMSIDQGPYTVNDEYVRNGHLRDKQSESLNICFQTKKNIQNTSIMNTSSLLDKNVRPTNKSEDMKIKMESWQSKSHSLTEKQLLVTNKKTVLIAEENCKGQQAESTRLEALEGSAAWIQAEKMALQERRKELQRQEKLQQEEELKLKEGKWDN